MKYYILVETATGYFETYAYIRTIDLFDNYEDAYDKLQTLKDAFIKEQFSIGDEPYVIGNKHLFQVIRPCEDCCYSDNSEYSLEIRVVEKE